MRQPRNPTVGVQIRTLPPSLHLDTLTRVLGVVYKRSRRCDGGRCVSTPDLCTGPRPPKEERAMSPDLAAQIIATAWMDASFAEALQGPDPYGAIQAALGVTVPPGTPLPEIPPAPEAAVEGLSVRSGVAVGQCSTHQCAWKC